MAANIPAIIGGFCVLGMNLAGWAADRIGNKSSLMVSFTLMALFMLELMFSTLEWHFYLFAVFFGLAYGGMQILFSPLAAELFGLRSHGVILGAAAFLGSIGAALGPFITGYVFDLKKSYDIAFLTCLIMLLIGVILTRF